MRIGIFDPYIDDIGGGERYMLTIASCLSKENLVDVFWDNKADIKKIEERFNLDLTRVNTVKNIFSSSVSFKEKILSSKKYDVIVFLSDGSIPFLLSRKIFLHIQQPITSLNVSLGDKLKLVRINKIFCNSMFTKKFTDKVYGINSFLLYPPVSIYGIGEEKENIIMHVGRFRTLNVKSDDYKKQQVMVNAFKDLVDGELKNWKFILAVSLNDEKDPKFLDMKQSAKDYPIEFLINSNKEKLWETGSKAKIYWHASGFGEDLEKNPELAEHFGISTVEAMGVGAVPVVINAGGQREIVRDGENGFLWGDLDEFKEKTLKLIKDEKLRLKLSRQAFEDSKFFSEEHFYRNVKALIND